MQVCGACQRPEGHHQNVVPTSHSHNNPRHPPSYRIVSENINLFSETNTKVVKAMHGLALTGSLILECGKEYEELVFLYQAQGTRCPVWRI